MALIKLIILDDDDEYSFNLCNFLTHNYPDQLLVNYCSNSYDIEEWIKKIDPDILLTCEKHYYHASQHFKKTIIILTSGINSSNLSGFPSIFKYKDVNKIAGDIINNFINTGNLINNTKDKNVKVISTFSATGNTGKTTIAMGVSQICSLSGQAVFYLNLEQFQSTNFFFSSNTDYSLSDIIFYSKEVDKNLISKLSSFRCQDPSTNIFYFREANNSFELNELQPEDINYIISNLKDCGLYDLIVIDMDSRLDKNAIEIFRASDEVLYVFNDEEICLHKTEMFLDSLRKFSNSSNHNTFLAHNFLYVANKVSDQALPLFSKFISDKKILSKVPFCSKITSRKFNIMGGPEIIHIPFKEIAGRYLI